MTAFRCIGLNVLVSFYRDVTGLEPTRDPEVTRSIFFRNVGGFAGHTSVLALFRSDIQNAGQTWGGDLLPATGLG
jgi:hypothetical protein